jgi:hypothetical protein
VVVAAVIGMAMGIDQNINILRPNLQTLQRLKDGLFIALLTGIYHDLAAPAKDQCGGGSSVQYDSLVIPFDRSRLEKIHCRHKWQK